MNELCLSRWVTRGSVHCEGIFHNPDTDVPFCSAGFHLQSPGLHHRRSAADRGLHLGVLLSPLIIKQLLRCLHLQKSFILASFLVQFAGSFVLCTRLSSHSVSVCPCCKSPRRAPEELLHVCVVLVALGERGVTHPSSILGSGDVVLVFARCPMRLKLIYKPLRFYSSASCCQPPPCSLCRSTGNCSGSSPGCCVLAPGGCWKGSDRRGWV